MLVLLPLLGAFLLFARFYWNNSAASHPLTIQMAIGQATVAWAFAATAFSEGLSLTSAVGRPGLSICWGLLVLVLAYSLYSDNTLIRSHGTRRKCIRAAPEQMGWFAGLCAFLIALIMTATAVTALVSVPNNWDSMTYHLPRVMHWLQNGSVEHYYTAIDRQLSQPPLAEYMMLQFAALSSYDAFYNLVQWGAALSSVAAVSHIAALLGANRNGRWGAALFAATLPMFVLQSNSTQNDLLCAAMLLWAVAFGLEEIRAYKPEKKSIILPVVVALALLAKGTAYIYILPFLMLWSLLMLRKYKVKTVRLFVVIAFSVVLVNGSHWMRNARTFDSPLGPDYELRSQHMNPQRFLSVAAQNAALELRFFKGNWNASLEHKVRKFSEWMGVDPNHEDIHWAPSPWFGLQSDNRKDYFHEDYAPAPLHLIILGLTVLFLLIRGFGNKSYRPALFYAWAVLLAACLFAGLLKWQIWHNRLHLPLLMLATPLFGLLPFRRRLPLPLPLLAAVFVFVLPFVLQNWSRPLLGEPNIFKTTSESAYFRTRPDAQANYEEVCDMIKDHRAENIALLTSADSWEYPIWVFLARDSRATNGFAMPRIEHFDPDKSTEYEYVLNWVAELDAPQVRWEGTEFRQIKGGASPTLYERLPF